MARPPFARPKFALSRTRNLEKMSERGTRSISQRRFEVGPEPAQWPAFMGFDAIRTGNSKHVMLSTIRENWLLIMATTLANLVVYIGSALIPWALGVFLDSGIEQGLTAVLIPGMLLMLGMVMVRALGAFAEPFGIVSWMRGAYGWSLAVARAVSGIRGGGREKIPSGEIVSAATSDAPKLGNLLVTISSSIASTASFVVIATFMLTTNLKLGLIVTIGLPAVILLMTLLVSPLQKRLRANREERGKLTTLAADAVTGLRVLRGVGGEDTYDKKYDEQSLEVMRTGIVAALLQAVLGGLTTAVPAIFTAVIIGMGLMEVFHGNLSYGDLVAFYGYTAYLSVPVSAATQFFTQLSDARVGAERIQKIMQMHPLVSDADLRADAPQPQWSNAALRDDHTGVVLFPGKLTAFVANDPHVSATLAEHFSRIDDEFPTTVSWHTRLSADAWTGEQQVRLQELPQAEVRKNIVLSSAVAQLFQGRLRSNLNGPNADVPIPREISDQMRDTGDGAGIATRDHEENALAASDDELQAAIALSDAEDIVLGLEGGLDGYVAERGRSLSGGQRQRLALARAVLPQSPVLILIEPTSAVDSHTEARIAAKLKKFRAGRTTLVVSSSPIVLGIMDEVVLLDDAGHELARGLHHELLNDSRYHAIVNRAAGATAEDDGVTADDAGATAEDDGATETSVVDNEQTGNGKEERA